MEEAWDLVVVGAGPAGAAAALGALAQEPGSRVLLLDRADFPRDKSCGDGIAPHVLDALATVGATGVVDGWTPVRRLALVRGTTTAARDMRRPAYVVPRAVFDARLVECAVAAGATLRRHHVHQVRVRPDGVDVDGITAPVVVAADGAHSVVRTALGMPPFPRQALALRGYAPTPADRAGNQVIVFGARAQPSYAWSFDRGDGLSNVGYGELVDPAHPLSRSLLLQQLEALLPGAASTGGSWRGHHLPLSGRRWTHRDGRVLLAGDAAGLVNPISGEGIFYAVATGIAAGRAARDGRPQEAGRRYGSAVRNLLGRHLRHTAFTSRLTRSSTVVEAGVRASAHDQVVFDDLVEMGLGRGRLTPRLAGGLARQVVATHVPFGPRE